MGLWRLYEDDLSVFLFNTEPLQFSLNVHHFATFRRQIQIAYGVKTSDLERDASREIFPRNLFFPDSYPRNSSCVFGVSKLSTLATFLHGRDGRKCSSLVPPGSRAPRNKSEMLGLQSVCLFAGTSEQHAIEKTFRNEIWKSHRAQPSSGPSGTFACP